MRGWKKWTWVLLLAALAVLGNYFKTSLFFGLELIWGSIAAMVAVALLGVFPGVLVALAGGIYTWLLWGHGYALVIFGLEALVTGLLLRRARHLGLANALYWLFAGVPLVLLFYHHFLGLNWDTTWTVAFKQMINGILNALLASFLVQAVRASWPALTGDGRRGASISALMFNAFLAVGLGAGLAATVAASHAAGNNLYQDAGKELNAVAQRVAHYLLQDEGVSPQRIVDARLLDQDVRLALLSQDGQVLAQQGQLHSLKQDALVSLEDVYPGLQVWLPEGAMALVARWRAGHYVLDMPRLAQTDLRLVLERSAGPSVARLGRIHLEMLGLMAVIALASVGLAGLLSRWLTQPLVEIEALSRALPGRVTAGQQELIAGSRILEFDKLRSSLQAMADTMTANFRELRQMRDSLEAQVQERTAALRQREQALEEFKTTLDQTLDCIFMFDAQDLRFFYANQGALDQVGYSRDELFLLHPYDIKPDVPEAAFRKLLAPLLTGTQKSLTFEAIHRNKQGVCLPVEVFIQYVEIQHQRPRFVNIVRDITERQQSERTLRKSEERLQLALKAARSSLWDANPVTGRIVLDERWTELLGQPPHETEISFQELAQRVPPEEQADVMQKMIATIKGQISEYQTEHRVRHQQGHWVWIESRGRVVERDAAGRALRMIGTNTDITERKRLDQMKSEFVSTVSHELRTPLTSISGALGLAMGGALGELPGPLRQMLDLAHKNSQRLAHLINDLLDMEKLAAGKMHFDLRHQPLMPLVAQVIDSTRAYADQHQVTFVLSERVDGLQVQVDGGRLQQVLANFLSNAAKFSPPGAQVEVRVYPQPDGWVRVEVRDHGPGIPAQFRDRIFQKFSQADASDTRQKGGTGLGLAISKELMERMGGRIGFESEEGQGACFYIELAPVPAVGTAT